MLVVFRVSRNAGVSAYRLLMPAPIAVVGVVLLVGAPAAHADSQDDRYLAALSGQGIAGPPDQLIADSHAASDNYGTPGLVGQMLALERRGLANVQASNLLVTAVRAYCPEKSPLGALS